MSKRHTLVLLAFTGLPVAVMGQEIGLTGSREEAESQMEAWRTARRAMAAPATLSTAYWSVATNDSAQVILISTVPESVAIDVEAFAANGERFPLGRHEVSATRHLALDLREMLRPYGEEAPRDGSLRVSFVGDARTLSGWLVQHRGAMVVEVPLHSSLEVETSRWHSFFSLQPPPGPPTSPHYFFANHGARRVSYSLDVGVQGKEPAAQFIGIVDPGAQVPILPMIRNMQPLARQGWLILEHDGDPDDIVITGFLRGPKHLSSLPVFPSEQQPSHSYQAVRVPAIGSPDSSTIVTFWAPGEASLLQIDLLSAEAGGEVAKRTIELGAGTVASIRLESLFVGALPKGDFRLRLEGSEAFHVSGFGSRREQQGSDIAFFAGAYGHNTGSYPVPNVAEHEVFATLVNVGDEEASVVAELYWRDGAYSHGPFVVRAGASHRISIDELIREGKADLLGRRIPRAIEGGLLRWATVGAGELIARTEVRRRGEADTFGFNCKSCCEQFPYGAIIPELAEFLPGQSVPFQSAYYYSACDGTMGPYPIPPESKVVPPPFSWDGSSVTASSGADAEIEFEATVQARSFMCFSVLRWIFGKGRAEICKRLHLDPWSATTACNQQTTSCTLCNACCWSQYNYKVCAGKDPFIRENERNTCLGICTTSTCS